VVDGEVQGLREEVAALLADAQAEQHLHEDQIHNMGLALASRDIFGQAKGIIMVTMHCDADTAFDLIRKQSQAENRKAAEVAAEIVARVSRRAVG
jgi:AmiR/NasT family two-component response regulator